ARPHGSATITQTIRYPHAARLPTRRIIHVGWCLCCSPLVANPSNQPQTRPKKSFIDFQRLTTTHSSTIALISPHFCFTLTLTFFVTCCPSTTCRQTSFCQDFSLFMEGPHSDSLGRSLALPPNSAKTTNHTHASDRSRLIPIS